MKVHVEVVDANKGIVRGNARIALKGMFTDDALGIMQRGDVHVLIRQDEELLGGFNRDIITLMAVATVKGGHKFTVHTGNDPAYYSAIEKDDVFLYYDPKQDTFFTHATLM